MSIQYHFIFHHGMKCKRIVLKVRQARWLILSVLAILCTSLFAAEEKAFRPYFDYAKFHSGNILLAPDDTNEQTLLGSPKLSDTFSRKTIGFSYDDEISRQHLTADLKINSVRFDRLSQLDYLGKDFSANWEWNVGNHIKGNLGGSYVKTLTSFEDFHKAELNLQTQRREFLNSSWLVHPSWRLLAGISKESIGYSLASQLAENRNENVKELGLDFVAASQNSIGLQVRQIRDEFPAAVNIDSTQNELRLKIDWHLSEKTKLVFSGGRAARKYDHASADDFSGLNARATGSWSPSGKLDLNFAIWREIATAYDFTNLYSLNRGLSIEPSWRLSEKLRFVGSLKYEDRDYVANAAGPGHRRDTVKRAMLTLRYSPFRHVLLDASLSRDTSRSTIPSQTYSANTVMVDVGYKF
jgi:exopolysaccharide biosynthesis operon protein EpsL